MRKFSIKNVSFIIYITCGLCYFTAFLTILCFWQTRQIRFLTHSRQSEYRILAVAEAERAIRSYDDGAAVPEVYHALCTTAEYFAMSDACPVTSSAIAEISRRYLQNGVLNETDWAFLAQLSQGETDIDAPPADPSTVVSEETKTESYGSMQKCRIMAEKIVGVRGICRQVWIEEGGNTVLFYFDNGYIRMRLRDALPLEWVFSYAESKNTTIPVAELKRKAARCIPDVTLTIRDIRAAEDGYFMHFSGKMGSGRLFIRESDGRVTAFFTDPSRAA